MVGKTLQSVTGFAAGFDAVGICVDTPPYKRSDISPEYKAHRERAPAVFHEQMRTVIEQLDRDGYHILGAKGFEADDVIATVCEWQLLNSGVFDGVAIFSADKDMLALIRPGVEVISSATGVIYKTREEVVAKLGVRPELVPDWLALVGDKSDGLPGIKGVGPKTAAAWLDRYGSLESVLQNADKLEPERFREAVAAGKDIIAKSFLLAQLMDDAPINPEILMERKEPQREPVKEAEPEIVPSEATITALVPTTGGPAALPVEYERSLEPRDSAGAWKLAQYLHQSRMFGQFQTPEAVLAIILAGRAHGLGAFQSLQGFYNIQGKPSASSAMLVGLCKRHPACKYFRLVKSTPELAMYETQRLGDPEPTQMTYTIEQAKLANLTGKDNWKKDPAAMLMARASSRLARAVYPDLCVGLYTPDEIEDAK